LQSSLETAPEAQLKKNQLPDALGPDRSELLTEDLATFLVAHYITVTKNDSIKAIKEYFASTPDVAGCVEDILCQLEDVGLITVNGDKLTFLKKHIDMGNNPSVLARFLPRLFKMSVDRLLTNAKDGSFKKKKEGLRYFVLPDSPEVASEAKALYLEYKSKMLALIEKAEKQGTRSEGIRLIGSLNCVLNPEDFA
jgi:hypothetical protein